MRYTLRFGGIGPLKSPSVTSWASALYEIVESFPGTLPFPVSRTLALVAFTHLYVPCLLITEPALTSMLCCGGVGVVDLWEVCWVVIGRTLSIQAAPLCVGFTISEIGWREVTSRSFTGRKRTRQQKILSRFSYVVLIATTLPPPWRELGLQQQSKPQDH